jgi:hypothetical protein
MTEATDRDLASRIAARLNETPHAGRAIGAGVDGGRYAWARMGVWLAETDWDATDTIDTVATRLSADLARHNPEP